VGVVPMQGFSGIVVSLWAVIQAGFAVLLPLPYSYSSFTPSFVRSSAKDEKEQTKEDQGPHRSTDDSSNRYLIIAVAAITIITIIRSTVWVVRIVGS
jgi:hypothetical protein